MGDLGPRPASVTAVHRPRRGGRAGGNAIYLYIQTGPCAAWVCMCVRVCGCALLTEPALPRRRLRLQTGPGARAPCFLRDSFAEKRAPVAALSPGPGNRFVDRAAQAPESNTVHSVSLLPAWALRGVHGGPSSQKQTPRLTVLHAQVYRVREVILANKRD